jgi:hypothetical protein
LPRPEDELVHVPVGDPSLPWKDTWYFSIHDPAADVLLNMHMTISANRSPATRIAVGVRHGNRDRVAVHRSDGFATDGSMGNELARLDVLNLSWDSEHRLRWRAGTPEVEFDIEVRGVHFAPLWDAMFPAFYPDGRAGHSYGHTEQVITGTGWVRWRDGSVATEVSGVGWRDRGWGRRKSELTFDSGYDLCGGILPDGSVFALSAIRSTGNGVAGLPIAAWRADHDTLLPCVSGRYYKDSMSFPTRLDLEFLDGHRLRASQRRRLATLGTMFHDAEPENSGIAHGARDYYALMVDEQGSEFTLFSNEGHMLRADVTRDAQFSFVAPPADR